MSAKSQTGQSINLGVGVQDEGVQVAALTENINFIGVDVTAVLDAPNSRTNVTITPSADSSDWEDVLALDPHSGPNDPIIESEQSIIGEDEAGASGRNWTARAGDHIGAGAAGFDGGNLTVRGGDTDDTAAGAVGGTLNLRGGNSEGGNGGVVAVLGGEALTATGAGGAVTIDGGISTDAAGGTVTITGGVSPTAGGNVDLVSGDIAGSGGPGPGSIGLTVGDRTNTGNNQIAGQITLTGGANAGGSTSPAGGIEMQAGAQSDVGTDASSQGGRILITAGGSSKTNSPTSPAGEVTITGGPSVTGGTTPAGQVAVHGGSHADDLNLTLATRGQVALGNASANSTDVIFGTFSRATNVGTQDIEIGDLTSNGSTITVRVRGSNQDSGAFGTGMSVDISETFIRNGAAAALAASHLNSSIAYGASVASITMVVIGTTVVVRLTRGGLGTERWSVWWETQLGGILI